MKKIISGTRIQFEDVLVMRFSSNRLKIAMAMAVLITSNTQVNTFVSSLDHLFLPLKVRDTGWGGAFALLTQKLQV